MIGRICVHLRKRWIMNGTLFSNREDRKRGGAIATRVENSDVKGSAVPPRHVLLGKAGKPWANSNLSYSYAKEIL